VLSTPERFLRRGFQSSDCRKNNTAKHPFPGMKRACKAGAYQLGAEQARHQTKTFSFVGFHGEVLPAAKNHLSPAQRSGA
jgi:hypothetical protein